MSERKRQDTDKDKIDFAIYAYQWSDMPETHHQAEGGC